MHSRGGESCFWLLVPTIEQHRGQRTLQKAEDRNHVKCEGDRERSERWYPDTFGWWRSVATSLHTLICFPRRDALDIQYASQGELSSVLCF